MNCSINHQLNQESEKELFNHAWQPLVYQDLQGQRVPYIAIEGVKGVGKGTVLKIVRERLAMFGVSALALNPTQALGSNHYWEQLDQALPLRHLDWWKERLYAARSQVHSHRVYEELIQKQSTEHKVDLVLGDRSIFTSLVTRWPDHTSNETITACYQKVRQLECSIPLPDQVIYLEADLKTINDRLHGRERHYGLEDETQARIMSAMEAYQCLANSRVAPFDEVIWSTIDATQSIEQTVSQIMEIVLERLNFVPDAL